ncbi:MAG: nucleotidyltransferase domain-containing protein [Candidatus Fermentibacteria bacterium]|nr:nucleotidyltransferase domain-containing protein [Candidatus Fermentibacteria bacterium]
MSDDVIRGIRNVFRSFPELEQVVLYGSRAMGNFRNGSDIDITLKGTELNLHVMNRISLSLDDLMLPYTFDISIYDHIDNEELVDHIERKGVVFYSAGD